MTDVFPGEYPPLAEHHRRYLHEYAITDDVIAQHRICSNDALDEIIFPWTDGKDTVFVRRPEHPKKLDQKYIWPAGKESILWKLRPAVGNNYILVEGVKQSLAVLSWAPYHYGVVGMNGAWGWKKTDLSWAKDKDITIILDGDRKINEGVAKAASSLSSTLAKYECKSSTYVTLQAAGTKGIDDELGQLKAGDRADFVQRLLDNATFSGRRLNIRTALEHKPKRRRWLYKSYLPSGNFCLLAGYEGTAKSTLATDIVARVTRGELDGDYFGSPQNAIYITAEEDWDIDIVPRLIATGANRGNVLTTFVQHESGAEMMVSLDRDLQEIERVIEEKHVTLMVFDSLLYFLGDHVDYDKSSTVNDLLLPLVQVGLKHGCTVLGILHFNKGSHHDNPLDKIANSKAFARIARAIWLTAKHDDHFVMSVEKLSGGLLPPPLNFRLESVTLPPEWDDDGHQINTVKIEWMGESDVTVSELIDMKQRGEDTSTKAVDEWMIAYMDSKGGKVEPKELMDAGKREEGYSESTLRRAKKRLDIKSDRTGYGKAGIWEWYYKDDEMELMRKRGLEAMGI